MLRLTSLALSVYAFKTFTRVSFLVRFYYVVRATYASRVSNEHSLTGSQPLVMNLMIRREGKKKKGGGGGGGGSGKKSHEFRHALFLRSLVEAYAQTCVLDLLLQ